jgi:hypothetical protein
MCTPHNVKTRRALWEQGWPKDHSDVADRHLVRVGQVDHALQKRQQHDQKRHTAPWNSGTCEQGSHSGDLSTSGWVGGLVRGLYACCVCVGEGGQAGHS